LGTFAPKIKFLTLREVC